MRDFRNRNAFISETIQLRKPSLKNLTAVQYLSSVESNIPDELISAQNFTEMKKLASHFTRGITSFFGFESRLNSPDARADYLFAVSARKGEREALLDLITSGKLPETFLNQPEWQRVGNFVTEWAKPKSILNNKVFGIWFEFDTVNSPSEAPVPCVFMHTVPLHIDNSEDVQKCTWLTRIALPLLTGQPLSQTVEQHVLEAIQRLPEGVSVFQVGTMLSRTTAGVRLVFNRMQPVQIMPYLKTLGWSDNNDRLSSLLEELEHYVTRIILHINIGEKGVDPKIGLECSFYPDLYNLETKWPVFLNYLVKKGLCLPEKKAALLHFSGVEQQDMNHDFDLKSYITVMRIPDNNFSSALVRYISHIKLVYKPNHPTEAKVYSGVRLFGFPHKSTWESPEGIY
ncbi:MAG: hypothetical protein MUO73_08855 [Thermoplasmata archaeon]|nr:hypothetical protein [Thermoplasmata archaeon]